MNPEQFKIFLERNEKSTAEVIERTVNGKINNLTKLVEEHNAKHEDDMKEVRSHIAEVRPYLDSARGVKFLGETGKWIASTIVVVAAAWALLFKQ